MEASGGTHTRRIPATSLFSIKAAPWFLISSLVFQRESELMGADSNRNHSASQEMGKSWHCAASWYKSWKFPFFILMYICKIVNQCQDCCTRKREKSSLVNSQQAVLCKHSAFHSLLLAQSRKLASLAKADIPCKGFSLLLLSEKQCSHFFLLPYFLGYITMKVVPILPSWLKGVILKHPG